MADDLARHLGVHTGDQLAVQFARGQLPLMVRGVYDNQNFIGIFGQSVPLLVSPTTLNAGTGGTPQDSLVLVRTAGGARPATQRRLVRELATDFPNISVLTRAQFRADQQAQVDQFLTVLIAILTLSEIIAILGIINTLALSVFERTRELGLLRVVGMSRRQMRRMVRWESVVIAVLGGVVGLALGMLWGWAFSRALARAGPDGVPDPGGWRCCSSSSDRWWRACSPRCSRRGGRRASTCSTPSRPSDHPGTRRDGCYHDPLTGRLAQG